MGVPWHRGLLRSTDKGFHHWNFTGLRFPLPNCVTFVVLLIYLKEMKFIASSSSLLKHLQQINGVISSNTVLPILEDFLFEIEGKKLTIVASDLETTMRVHMEIDSKEDGKVCIPGKVLIDTLKNIADQPLGFHVDEKFIVEITSANGKYKVPGEDPDNFPKAPSKDDAVGFPMSSGALVKAINKTLFAVSNDDLRPAMTGVLFEMGLEQIQFVATDAHRLVRYRRTDTQATVAANIIVPKKPLNLLKNSLPDNDDEIIISHNSNHLFVDHGDIQLVCRLIEARFPDYKVVIPDNNPYRMEVAKPDFQSALRRVSIFSNKSTNQAALIISQSELQILAQDIDFNFEGNERIPCTYDGDDMQIAFNAKFLIEMLNAVDTPDIALELSTPGKAGLLKPTSQLDNEDILMLLMPLMLNN